MGWSYAFWKGAFYPKALAAKDFLAYYSRKINSVEVNNTFYQIPTEKTFAEWKKQTPDGFKFSLKFPARITHIKMLKNTQEETRVFLERARVLEEKLGVLLIQLSPTFGIDRFSDLSRFLSELPKDYLYSLEIRNKSLLNDRVYTLLKENKVALAWIDATKTPVETTVTSNFIYVRWEGDRKVIDGTKGMIEQDRSANIMNWAAKLEKLLNSNTEVFGYFSKYYSGLPTADATRLMESVRN